MTSPRRILILGGILIAAFGMLFGLHYAVFVEHQTLDRMGGSLATAFVQAANRDMTQAGTAIDSYAAVKYDYVREVDAHSHWVGLSMILIVLGAFFDRVGFSIAVRQTLAWSLLLGSIAFPFGVILQATHHGGRARIRHCDCRLRSRHRRHVGNSFGSCEAPKCIISGVWSISFYGFRSRKSIAKSHSSLGIEDVSTSISLSPREVFQGSRDHARPTWR